jgi:dienelactone hydrolase
MREATTHICASAHAVEQVGRRFVANTRVVQRAVVEEPGVVGVLFTSGDEPRPGVVVLSGSEGGCPTHAAELLASEGLACLALTYFHGPGVPKTLVEIPLDYIETAMHWLLKQPSVTGERIGLLGASKGAELALLCASMFPSQVGAVVAYAPSSVVFAGISFRGDGRRRSSWAFRGTPVPFVPYAPGARPSLSWRGLKLAPMYDAALADVDAATTAAIPIERADADILLISGDRDSMWSSTAMAQSLAVRLLDAGKIDRLTHLRYPDAGHSLIPWSPATRSTTLARIADRVRLAGFGGLFELGGRPRANREAHDDAWPQVVAFLADSLTTNHTT